MDGEAEKACMRLRKVLAANKKFYGYIQFNYFYGKLIHTSVNETFKERTADDTNEKGPFVKTK